MAAQCPVCTAEVLEDFGSTECESCGAQLIVHIDGTVEALGHQQAEAGEDPPSEQNYEFGDSERVLEEEPGQGNAGDIAEQGAKPDIFADPEPSVYRAPQTPADSPDLSDIARFGNSEASSSRDGALRYNLRIGGIDTVDVREALREALTDRKFLWDIDQILRSIRNGEVQIPNVTATKAFMLVSRLRTLPVKVKWEQYAVHQP